jgi:hypothetical protein
MIREEWRNFCSPPEGERELASVTPQVPWGDFFLSAPHRNARRALRLPLRGGVGTTHHAPRTTLHEAQP